MRLPSAPSAASLQALAAAAHEIIAADGARFLTDYLRWHQRRLALDYEWLTLNVPAAARVLEVGGYPFFLSSAMLRSHARFEVVDKRSGPAEFLVNERRGIVHPCNVETEPLPFAADTFDEVIFNEIFEHLRVDPIFTLREVLRVLRPGGRLWLSTPNLGSLKGIANLALRNEAWAVAGEGVFEQYRHIELHGWMGHVREYTSREVADFLRRIGFAIELVKYRGEYGHPLARAVARLYPRMLPYFTCIARKPAAAA